MNRTLSASALIAVCLSASPALAETSGTCTDFIAALPAVLGAKGVYCMNKDLATSIMTGNAITIGTNGITLDCNGYRISGLGAGAGSTAVGVYASNKANFTLRNCGLRGFYRGVRAVVASSLVEDNFLDQNLLSGIEVEGDGNLVRRNRVLDTGGTSAPASSYYGIYAEGATDIRDNFVDGVVATGNTNANVYGVRQSGGSAISINGNQIRGLVPSGTGRPYGIYPSNGLKVVMNDNIVLLEVPVAGSIGIRCNSSNGSLRDNTAWGFDEGLDTSCYDEVGNAAH